MPPLEKLLNSYARAHRDKLEPQCARTVGFPKFLLIDP